MRNLQLVTAGAILGLMFATTQAQAAPPASTNATAPAGGMGMGAGMGMGMGPHGGGMRAGPGVTMGWSMMTAQERREHRAKMMSFTSAKACRAYVEQHHKLMSERARQRGMAMPAAPAHDPCAGLAD